MKFHRYIYGLALALTLAACSDEMPGIGGSPASPDGDFTFDVSLNVAELGSYDTRTFGDSPSYQDLKLYVAEFDLKEGPLDGNMLSAIYTPEEETLNADGDIHFKLTLNKSMEPKVLHLIAVPKSTDLSFPAGLEGEVIPNLTVTSGADAYWQRVEFPDGYGKQTGEDTWIVNEDVKEKLTHVPMIRNFAKISVTSTDPNFTLEGFTVVNPPRSGSVAPWNTTDMVFPEFLDDNGNMKSYSQLGYEGILRGYINTTEPADADFTRDSKYLYERPTSSVNNTYIMIKGRRGNGTSKYYKLDIGSNDRQNIFDYKDVIRNFEYAVTLTGVNADGYASIADAKDGVVYNNFSFDVNTRQMLNISDGKAMIWVNNTTFVVNDDNSTTVTFRYRFKSDITSSVYDTEKLKFRNEEGDVSDNISVGGVITSVSQPTQTSDGWYEVSINTVTPQASRHSTRFIVFDPATGLGRTIEIVVRVPWYYKELGVWGGNYNTSLQFNHTTNDVLDRDAWEGYVSCDNGGQPLTVVFTLDNDIPEALFPLTFTVEAELQNIENNKIGTLVVSYGDSFFSPGKTRIKYLKTVTWTEYNTELGLGEDGTSITGTVVHRDDGTTVRRVRCRFLTIVNINESTTRRIRISNPYVKGTGGNQYGEVSFTGKYGQAPNWGLKSETDINASW